MAEVSKYDDVIDSRDVIERIEELKLEIESADPNEVSGDDFDEWKSELATLESLAKEANGYASDWEYGATLVRDSYFEIYAQDLAEDIGAINSGATWPNNCIDWERAARQLQMDYTSVDFDGVTYWVR